MPSTAKWLPRPYLSSFSEINSGFAKQYEYQEHRDAAKNAGTDPCENIGWIL
jgi:hypothetical protein